ncbi:MAG: ribonuclease H [Polyangiales bacterium]
MPWRTVVLRGTRVLARCDEAGKLADQGGRVEIRYRSGDAKSYKAATRNLEPSGEDEVFPDAHCGEAAAVSSPRSGTTVEPVSASAIVAYTDGACSGNPGPAGLGVVLVTAESRRELSEYLGVGTNNIAELTAILRALEGLGRSADEVVIHTDSQYAIGVLTKGWKAKANQTLIADIKERLRNFPRVRFVYVRGHAGIPLNERCDELARAAVVARETAGWIEVGRKVKVGEEQGA